MNGGAPSLQATVIGETALLLVVLCSAVFLLVAALLVRALGSAPRRPPDAWRWIVGGGILLPAVLLSGVFAHAVWRTGTLVDERGHDLVVTVIAHPWWWELRYPDPAGGSDIVTANELHLPVGRRVALGVTASDVIHSVWVPALGGKTDAIPGRTTHWQVRLAHTGTWRGQCAEFCGEQHARMALHVVGLEPAAFDAWLAAQARDAAAPADAPTRRGQTVFVERRCGACHAVRGVAAGQGGPDLTHVGSRGHLGAGTLPTNAASFAAWIADPQVHKPGVRMPAAADLAPDDLQALAAWLASLR